MARKPQEHLYVETDGQVYVVDDGGTLRFPRVGEALPFDIEVTDRMDFGDDVVLLAKPKLTYHPEAWHGRDELFSRPGVDGLVKKAVYMTLMRTVAELVLAKDGRVLMVKAKRGFAKGHWNLPGGFMEFGEAPDAAAIRETREEIGVDVVIDGLINTYVSGFPGKPTYTLGLVYRGRALSETFRLKEDEIEAAAWFSVPTALLRTRNPFAKWALVDFYKALPDEAAHLPVERHFPPEEARRRVPQPPAETVFLDRDGVVNRSVPGYVKTWSDFEFLPGAIDAVADLTRSGLGVVVVSNQDVRGWGLVTGTATRGIHARMLDVLEDAGAEVANVYVCPHHVLSACPCRKPRPGMLLAAARDLDLSPRATWMVGDKISDVAAGEAFGCRTVWIADGRKRRRFADAARRHAANHVAEGLADAVAWILDERARFGAREKV
jgi:D-glycero-D-manno-heptose 1,7-bisphosphate phosphatase